MKDKEEEEERESLGWVGVRGRRKKKKVAHLPGRGLRGSNRKFLKNFNSNLKTI